MKEQNRLSGKARGRESESNMNIGKSQATGNTGQPNRLVNASTFGEENDGPNSLPMMQEHGGGPLELKRYYAENAGGDKKELTIKHRQDRRMGDCVR